MSASSPSLNARLAQAEIMCGQRGERLTPLRRRVLEILLRSERPLGAYEILDLLRADGRGGGPPTVYRALDFLLQNGLVHRLATLNAYTSCHQPDRHHGAQFLICTRCHRVRELGSPELSEHIRTEASRQGFSAASEIVEIQGQCNHCRDAGADRGA